jgi:hypothetical protein
MLPRDCSLLADMTCAAIVVSISFIFRFLSMIAGVYLGKKPHHCYLFFCLVYFILWTFTLAIWVLNGADRDRRWQVSFKIPRKTKSSEFRITSLTVQNFTLPHSRDVDECVWVGGYFEGAAIIKNRVG